VIPCQCFVPRGAAIFTFVMLMAITSLTSTSVASPQASKSAQNPPAEAVQAVTPSPDAGVSPEYRIGAGDSLGITVWRELEASVQSVTVRPDGKISVPLIKEVEVLGLTPTELQKLLTTKLEPFIHGADVTVVVREIRSKKVYLVGAVKKEGALPLLSNMTILQVLSEAGGLTDFAKRKKIYILRDQNGKQVKLPFNYDAVIKGEHMEQNIPVLPDDTIVVPH
jgi:polysaccharide biosynthesis/export protein